MSDRTSDDYCECVVIYPSGHTRRGSIFKSRLMSAEQAVVANRDALLAYVAASDVDTVLKIRLQEVEQFSEVNNEL